MEWIPSNPITQVCTKEELIAFCNTGIGLVVEKLRDISGINRSMICLCVFVGVISFILGIVVLAVGGPAAILVLVFWFGAPGWIYCIIRRYTTRKERMV